MKARPTARVESDGSGDFKTLQAALDAVPPHSWIQLGPGRFSENLVIRKTVWISGQGESTVLAPKEPWREPPAAELEQHRESLKAAPTAEDRRKLEAKFFAIYQRPVMEIDLGPGAMAKVRDVRVTLPGFPSDGSLSTASAVSIVSGELELMRCWMVGSAGNGITVAMGAALTMEDCLVAAAWNTGVVAGKQSSAKIWNSVIRNCYYAGITVGADSTLQVRDSWITGAAWHGIRYDDASPTIQNCRIEGNARSGIYASGITRGQILGNVFVGNGMSGMSCWMNSRDMVARNTFHGQRREALALLGNALPTIEGNVFLSNHIAILQSRIQGKPDAGPPPPTLRRNLFHGNHTNALWAVTSGSEFPSIEVGSTGVADTGSLLMDPGLIDPAADRLEPIPGRAAHTYQVGAPSAALQRSRFDLQPEEVAILPDGAERDSKKWKRRQP